MDSKEKRDKLKRRGEAERCRDLGNFYFKNGHYEQAISAYLEGLSFLEEDYLLHCNLAQAFIKVKQFNRACCHASLAIELNPTFWKSYARLAKALYETGQKVESYEVLMQGFVLCDQKEELQKCFYHIPATSDEEANVKAAKKLKRLVTEESRRLMGEEAKKSKKTKEKKKMENNEEAEPAPTNGDTATTSAPSKTESTQKKPVDSQEIKKKPVDFQDIKNDQFLALAEKSSHEVYSGQKKEFEAFLKEGYEEAQKESFTKALECYRKALKIREEVPLKYLGLQDKHCLVITYILNLMRIKTNTFENLQQTIHDLKAIDEVGEFQIMPAFYYIRSLAYLKMNRFKAALEELDSCNELLSYRRSFPFKEYCWPSTTVIIKETTKEGLQQAINDLITQAKSGLLIVPTAVCRYIQCLEVSSHILPSEQIFLTDPDFVGYVTITCEEKCHIQYHLHCWKAYRERMSEFEKIADKVFS
ncbi:E3 ubiquitin-protein ligase TTC3-like [Nilaparvata lugens]|uniref:E3 ubiquitin-protein ligase TTC3-like n=1 Tax=Nilaparvata lugens TaxID=108931 RepID=UPI00193CA111|nr:E3 ubiquitin-protein ligase TTC3-like [Nilaparvata lugens]XP_039277661.1 E3 ubiquitin-protein ligase TTC3-like [Nilaparvata lugens]XP_039277662.1 E3 ubiquitin-protein ligase TTC3-like [Nilaparvata lugens]